MTEAMTQPPNAMPYDEDDDLLYSGTQFEEKVKYRGMFRAWLAVLRFDSMRSYEAYRPYGNRRRVTQIMLAVFTLAPILSGLLIYPVTLRYSAFEFGAFMRVFALVSVTSVLMAVVLVASIYAASHATAYVARRQFHSAVSGKEHYILSSLGFVPLFILGCILTVVTTGVTDSLPRYFNYYDNFNDYSPFVLTLAGTIPASLAMTLMIFSGYIIVQYIFSSVAIHRVRAMAGVMLTLLFMTVQVLALVWMLPFVAAVIAQGVAWFR